MNIFGNFNIFYSNANKSKKYTNNTLFTRRETEYSSSINQNFPSTRIASAFNRPYSSTLKISSTLNQKTIVPRIKKKYKTHLKTVPNSAVKRIFHEENYFYKNKDKSNKNCKYKSFIEMERFYNPKTALRKKNFQSKIGSNLLTDVDNNNLDYKNSIYLTEATTKKNPSMARDLIINKDYGQSTGTIYNDYSHIKNADILSKFLKDKLEYNRNEDLKTEYKDRITKYKNDKINLKKERISEFREKIRNQKIYLFSIKAKEELYLRTKEKYQNELEYLDDKIESFQTWKTLNQQFFSYKIEEYLKFLMYQKSHEKNMVEDLVEEVIRLKNDITKINSKMTKIELEKNKILRWIYFQIQLKEKKITLPNYYTIILENINDIENYFKYKSRKLSNSTPYKRQDSMNNTNILSLSIKKKDKLKKSIKKTRIYSSSDINLKSDIIAILNKKEGKEAYMRIKEYKNNLIYNIDEFSDRISFLERENLRLIDYRTSLEYKVDEMRNQLKKITDENNKIFDFYNYNLSIKQNELDRLKFNNSAMENIIKILHSLNYFKKVNKDKDKNKDSPIKLIDDDKEEDIIKKNKNRNPVISLSVNHKKVKKSKKLKKEELFDKIEKLYSMCKSVKFNDKKHYEILKEKGKILKNYGIIFSIFYIEYCVNYLVDYTQNFEKKHKDGKKRMRKILFDIERSHRMEKAEEMRNQRLKKFEELKKEVNRKYNKIFLHNKKINILVKKKKINKTVQKVKKIPEFEDFIHADSSDVINDYEHFYEEEKNI